MSNVRKNLLATIKTEGGDTALTLSLPAAPALIVGVAASGLTLAARGGTAPYAYSIVGGGSLPTGLSLNASTGAITGTPTAGGTYLFLAKVQDAASTNYTASFSLTVAAGFYSIDSPPPAEVGIAYRWQMRVYDVDGTLLTTGYSIVFGAPPTGVTMSAGGLFTGTPTVAGSARFTVRATSGGNSADFPMTLKVAPALTATTDVTTLPPSIVGQPYAGNVIPADGVPPYRCKVTAGANRPGLSISSAGKVTGKPTQLVTSGYTAPTVTVTDALGATATVVVDVPVRAAAAALPAGQVGIGNEDGSGNQTSIDLFAIFFGGGQDGALVCDGTSPSIPGVSKTGNVYKMSRDVYLTDLTIASGYSLDMNSCALYGSGTLDLSGASAGALFCSAPNGGNASGITGGIAANGGNTHGTLLLGSPGTAGASLGDSAAATAPDIAAGGLGWAGLSLSGYGGTGVGTAGHQGAFGVANRTARCPTPLGPPLTGAGPLAGGIGGPGGGGGAAGTLINKQGAGGGGGQGGPVAQINFRKLKTNASTASGAITVIAGNGGNGADNSTSNAGAGGGAMGGSGGYLQIRIAERIGSPVTKLAKANGGNGGNGGTNSANATNNGHGSDGAMGGLVELINILNCTVTLSTLGGPIAASGTAGGAGAEAFLTF